MQGERGHCIAHQAQSHWGDKVRWSWSPAMPQWAMAWRLVTSSWAIDPGIFLERIRFQQKTNACFVMYIIALVRVCGLPRTCHLPCRAIGVSGSLLVGVSLPAIATERRLLGQVHSQHCELWQELGWKLGELVGGAMFYWKPALN